MPGPVIVSGIRDNFSRGNVAEFLKSHLGEGARISAEKVGITNKKAAHISGPFIGSRGYKSFRTWPDSYTAWSRVSSPAWCL